MSTPNDLQPATYGDSVEAESFKDRGPWKWFLLGAIVILVIAGQYIWRQRVRAAEIGGEIRAIYARDIESTRPQLTEFREQVETWIVEAANTEPETWADERLNLSGLHRAQGIYLRIRAELAQDRARIEDAAIAMEEDAIPRCLGLSPTTLGSFYSRLDRIDPSWLENVAEAGDDVLRLRVLRDELEARVERDLPLMLDAPRSDYFLLAVERGEGRREHPVDVYLWDIRRGQLLLRTRTLSRGRLLSARIALGGNREGRPVNAIHRSGAVDCSIAAQVRAAAGTDAVEVGTELPIHEMPEPEPETQVDGETATDASNEDAPVEEAATEPPNAAEPAAE